MKKTTAILILLSMFSVGLFSQTKHEELSTFTQAKFISKVWDFKKNKKFKYKGNQPIIIDFNATWCTPCKAIHPYLVELQAEYGDKITIYSIDVDKEPDITDAFKITNIPALVFIKDGKTQYFMSVGKKTKEEIKQLIDTKLLDTSAK